VPIRVQSGDPAFDALPSAVAEWFEAAAVTLALGDEVVRGYRAARTATVSLREHSRALSSGVYLHADVTSALDVFFRAPLPDGSLFDTFAALPEPEDVQPALSPLHFDDLIRRLRLWRQLLHADSESLAVRAAFHVWQATGNKMWLQSHLPTLDRALSHLWRHPHRWSGELDLPKRAFTLDSWPVEFCAAPGETRLDTQASTGLGAQTKWCVHPGDAAQLHAACRDLALMHAAVGNESDAARWRERAEHLEAQLNSVGWNGQFYTHQIHLSPVRVRGVDEARQLAACNAFAMNAGVANQEQCAAILKEYVRRRELSMETSFSEWWSVQPPFPAAAFGTAPGSGANGGLWPLVGGELALAALQHGSENYGVETLRRYYDLAVKPRRSFAWYAPDGSVPHDGGVPRDESEYSQAPYDPSGASAMLRALVEGVCGVRDDGVLFDHIHLAPRWPATGQAAAEVEVSYASNPAYISYRWALDGGRMTLDWDCKAKHIDLHILLPRGNTPERVALNGRTHPYGLVSIEKSKYVDLSTEKKRGTVAITLK
jgi:hypothetical protein